MSLEGKGKIGGFLVQVIDISCFYSACRFWESVHRWNTNPSINLRLVLYALGWPEGHLRTQQGSGSLQLVLEIVCELWYK